MQSDQDTLVRLNQALGVVVGTVLLGIVCVAGYHYGTKAAGSVSKSYASSKTLLSEADARGHELAKAESEMESMMKKGVPTASPEMQEMIRAINGDYEANKRIGEQYRAPPPRWP
jgi:hypothetical protein